MNTYYGPNAFIGYNYIQTVSGTTIPDEIVDAGKLPLSPLYINNQENLDASAYTLKSLNSSGFTAATLFIDNPGTSHRNYILKAQVTVFGITSLGYLVPIATFNWGYQVIDGVSSTTPVSPAYMTPFQQYILLQYNSTPHQFPVHFP